MLTWQIGKVYFSAYLKRLFLKKKYSEKVTAQAHGCSNIHYMLLSFKFTQSPLQLSLVDYKGMKHYFDLERFNSN